MKIFLALLPYWDPFIPPSGIATLKGFLQKNGYEVKTTDVVVEKEFQDIYKHFFGLLEECVPEAYRGNFYNIGHDVLRDVMMAHVNRENDKDYYFELLHLIISKTFFVNYFNQNKLQEMADLMENLYRELEKYFLELLEREQPDVLGLTAYRNLLPACMFVFKLTKERYPHIMTVMGGSLFSDSFIGSDVYNMVLEKTKPYLDKIIIGEGEILFLKLLRGELPGSQRVYRLQDLGLERLDFRVAVPPDYTDFDISLYPYLPITGSTSCPFQCSFCNSKLYWGPFRKKDTKQLVDEMVDIYKKYGRQLLFMTDCLLNPIVTDLAHELLTRDISLYYDCFFRIDKASADIANTMLWRNSGLFRVRLGIESGSQHVLELMDKRITVEQIKEALSALAYAGIKTTAYMVVGHPGETQEDFQQTLDFLEEVKNDLFQVEFTQFTYSYAGLNHGKWDDKRILLFPQRAKQMLVFDRWTLDTYPSHEEMYRRLYQVVEHCKKLGIPNPYTLLEHYDADKRWKKLHKNAAPALIDFREPNNYIDENKNVKMTHFASAFKEQINGDFGF